MSSVLHNIRAKIGTLLRWSERYTKTDMVYLTKGGFWLVLGHIIQVGSGLVLAVAFANLLPKTAYGTYQFVMSIAAILSALTLSGMGIAIKQAVARGSAGALQYGFRTQLTWSIGIVLASGAIALYYFLNGNAMLAQAFLVVGALTPFIEGFSLYRSYLIGTQRFRESTLLGVWRRPVFIVAVLIALLFTDDPVILILVYFASSAVSAGLLYHLTVRRYNLQSELSPEVKNYSKHLSVMGLLSRIASNADKVLIFHFLGAAPVAIYTLATLPLLHAQKLFDLVGDLALAKFANRRIGTLRTSLPGKVLIFFLTSAALVALYFVLAPYIYETLFPDYVEAVILSQFAMLALLAKPRMLYDQVFIAHALKRAQYIIRSSATVLKVGMLILLIPQLGLWGAVVALLVTQVYMALTSIAVFEYVASKSTPGG